MVDLIRWLKRQRPSSSVRSAAEGEIVGFVYVGKGDSSLMTAAAPGTRIGSAVDKPPWIVVDHEPQSIVMAKWPGRLWKVRVVHRAAQQPLAYASYTRATAVDVLEEVPLAVLFEHNAEAVVEFLNSISQLTVEKVAALAESPDDEAARVHNAAWDRWLASADPASPSVGQEHAGTIAMGAKAPGSPVGRAPSVLYSQLIKRAQEIAGDAAFAVEEEEQYFRHPWSQAATCLQHSLFAIGVAEHLLSTSERAVLRRAYEKAMSGTARDDA
jgi:hypothetical protein